MFKRKPKVPRPPRPPRPPLGPRLRRLAKTLGIRLYALGILVLVAWTGYTAVAYLVRYVFWPPQVPAHLLDPSLSPPPAPQIPPEAALALTTMPAMESPIAQYHLEGQPIRFSTGAGCIASGCHAPLPHTRRKEVRAFANFHTTFLSCQMCHTDAKGATIPAKWVDRNHTPIDAPALLKLANLLQTRAGDIEQKPATVHDELLRLIRAAQQQAGRDDVLQEIFVRLDTSEPGSPVWRGAARDLATLLPNRMRGEYGGSITPADLAPRMAAVERDLREQTRRYLAAAPDSPERKRLYDEIHTDVMPRPNACLSCHGGEPSRIDLAALGYTAERIATLRSQPIASMIGQLTASQPFYLPTLLEDSNAP